MKKLAITGLCLALVAGVISAQQQNQNPVRKKPSSAATSPRATAPSNSQGAPLPTITDEEVFLYNAVIFGSGVNLTKPYAIQFDTANYKEAMANEFSRAQYLERMQAKLQEELKKVDFSRKFTITGQSALGEYSFVSHSFPVFGAGGVLLRNIEVFSVQNAVNKGDFIWALPMSEIEAKAFVSRRTVAGGRIDRTIFTKTIYSILDQKGRAAGVGGAPATFVPFIYSVEVYSDASLTKRLGVIPKISSQAPNTPDEMRLVEERVKEEAPEKLRALLTTSPVLDGTLYAGANLTLRVLSFDSATGSVSAQIDFIGFGAPSGWEVTPKLSNPAGGHSSHAVGNVSGDTLDLTATWNLKDYFGQVTTPSMHFKLRFDGPGHKLVGPWRNNTTEGNGGTASFDLK